MNQLYIPTHTPAYTRTNNRTDNQIHIYSFTFIFIICRIYSHVHILTQSYSHSDLDSCSNLTILTFTDTDDHISTKASFTLLNSHESDCLYRVQVLISFFNDCSKKNKQNLRDSLMTITSL